jgi:hypothetical protein
MTKNSSRNCPESLRLESSTLWLITILCNVLLFSLRIEKPRNDPELPRNVNIDTFFWVVLGFLLRRNVITFWLQKLSKCRTPESPGRLRTFWVVPGHSGGHSGDFRLQWGTECAKNLSCAPILAWKWRCQGRSLWEAPCQWILLWYSRNHS